MGVEQLADGPRKLGIEPVTIDSALKVNDVKRRDKIDERITKVVAHIPRRKVDVVVPTLLLMLSEQGEDVRLRGVRRNIAQHDGGALFEFVEKDSVYVDLLVVRLD